MSQRREFGGQQHILFVLMLLLQAENGDAMNVDEPATEPIGVELSILVVMSALSVLCIWETGKHCLRTCWSSPKVCMIRPSER